MKIWKGKELAVVTVQKPMEYFVALFRTYFFARVLFQQSLPENRSNVDKGTVIEQ